MFPPRLFLASCLFLSSLLAHADLILQAPQDPIVAGRDFTLTLVVTNSTPEPLAVPAVATTLPVVVRRGADAVSAVFRLDEPRRPEGAPLAPGSFRRVIFRGRLPAELTGLVVLDASAQAAGRVAVEVVADDPAMVMTTPEAAPAAAVNVAPDTPRREFGLSPHEPIYFSVGANGGINARFQLSFKFRPIGPSDDRIAGRGFWEDVYMSFTQTSLWDLHSSSKPFTDSSYRPALFFHRYDTGAEFLGGRLGFSGGLEHESNGKGGADSRSINIAFARPVLRWGQPDTWQFTAAPKLYWYLEKSENDDIQRFRGYGDFLFALEHPRSWKLAATLRAGTGGHGSVQLDASYPFSRINSLFPLGLVHGYLHLQFFDGWGESLLHYDERAETQFRVGFMALR